jgi:hypothetical protein
MNIQSKCDHGVWKINENVIMNNEISSHGRPKPVSPRTPHPGEALKQISGLGQSE